MQAVQQANGALEKRCVEQEKQLGLIGRELAAYRDGEKQFGCSYGDKIAALEATARDFQLQRDATRKALEMLDFYYRHVICDPFGAMMVYLCYGKDGHRGDWDALLHTMFPKLRLRTSDLFSNDQKMQEQL